MCIRLKISPHTFLKSHVSPFILLRRTPGREEREERLSEGAIYRIPIGLH